MPHLTGQKMPAAQQKLIAVIPAFNEAGNIVGVIEELKAYECPGVEVGFVVVDDGSRDNTREVSAAAGAPVVSLPYNMGIGMTVQTGFKYALAHGADFVAQVDGDGQHIAAEITKLFEAMRKTGADVIVGTRFSKGQKDGLETTTFARWLAGRFLAFTVKFLTGKALSDTTSGFRLFNRKSAEFVARNYPDDYPEVQVLVLLARAGLKIDEVPVRMRSRAAGQSSINWWRSIYYVGKVIFASVMDRLR